MSVVDWAEALAPAATGGVLGGLLGHYLAAAYARYATRRRRSVTVELVEVVHYRPVTEDSDAVAEDSSVEPPLPYAPADHGEGRSS